MPTMRYVILFVFFLSSLFKDKAVASRIALTFDDAPRPHTAFFDGPTRARTLIRTLREAEVDSVTFFVNTREWTDEGRRRVQSYVEAGHTLGNHSHSHLDFNRVSEDAFLADIKEADRILRSLPGFTPFFRFPYLREGNTPAKRDAARSLLRQLGLRNAYITVNNYDWEMDRLLQQAKRAGKHIHLDRLKQVYLDVLLACVEFYDAIAKQTMGRSPAHVLLLHENDINALFVGDLVRALRHKGWAIVSPTEAYGDAIADFETPRIFPFNPGRVGEIARDRGFEGRLWHESCDEETLERLFADRRVFE